MTKPTRSEQQDATPVYRNKETSGFGRLLNHASLDLKDPSEDERYGKTKRNRCNKHRQNPVGCVISWQDCRAYLDDQPSDHAVAERDAIDVPLFQLAEERVHVGLCCVRTVGHFSRYVEAAIQPRKSWSFFWVRGVRFSLFFALSFFRIYALVSCPLFERRPLEQ